MLGWLAVSLAGTSAADGPDAGLRLYRDGLRPTGEPLAATVAGDVPVLGTQLSCESCHGRSGMGASEGSYVVPAIAGPILFNPSPQPARPAYHRESLARAVREGLSASGRPLNPLMPRYELGNEELGVLADYLETLSAAPSPGVDDQTIRLATVVTEGVAADAWEAAHAVLARFADDKNRQTRLEGQRPDRGSTPASRLPPTFRAWQLVVWELNGPEETWAAQLERYYQNEPVFLLVGGMTAGSWGPMGTFCERHEIPCLLPSTDLPAAEPTSFYTLHYSRGLALEADLIASHLESHPAGSVLQVYCSDLTARAAAGLSSRLRTRNVPVAELPVDCESAVPTADLAARLGESADTAVVLWLERTGLKVLPEVLPASRIYLSSTLLDRDLVDSLPAVRAPQFVAHPYVLPGGSDPAFLRFRVWARTRDIDIAFPRWQSEAFFACLAANDAIMHLERYFVRDYVLDMLDHAQGLAPYVPIHPRATLGPGQRFLTKGGYVLPLVNGRPVTEGAEWILP